MQPHGRRAGERVSGCSRLLCSHCPQTVMAAGACVKVARKLTGIVIVSGFTISGL